MHEFLSSDLIKIVTSILMLVISGALGVISNYYSKKSKITASDISQGEVNNIYYILERIVEDCVEATNQTFVDSLKKSGDFTKENQEAAFKKTFEAVRNIITEEITTDKINVEELIKQLIEKTVARKNTEKENTELRLNTVSVSRV